MAETASVKEMGSKEAGSMHALLKHKRAVILVCGYAGLEEPPYDEVGCSSFGMCPSCSTQFGYNDATFAHAELRKLWISKGMLWWEQSSSIAEWLGPGKATTVGRKTHQSLNKTAPLALL